MSISKNLINNLNSLQRKDPLTLNILDSESKELEILSEKIKDFKIQYYFDTMTWYADELAKVMGITFSPDLPIEEKRSIIEAKYKGDGKADIYLLQAVADSWKNGQVDVDFIDGKIKIMFNGIYGIPGDLTYLEEILDDVKPAHLPIEYQFLYFLINDVENKMTLGNLETLTLDKFAF